MFARFKVFQPHDMPTATVPVVYYQKDYNIKRFTPLEIEIAQEIDKHLNSKKAPEIYEISYRVLKQLPHKAIVLLTYIYNASLKLEHVPAAFKVTEVIMLKKPGKPVEDVASYRRISLLTSTSKLYEKILLKRFFFVSYRSNYMPFFSQYFTI